MFRIVGSSIVFDTVIDNIDVIFIMRENRFSSSLDRSSETFFMNSFLVEVLFVPGGAKSAVHRASVTLCNL